MNEILDAGESGGTKTDGSFPSAFFECHFQNVKVGYKAGKSVYSRAI